MKIEATLQDRVTRLFAPLDHEPATNLPATGALSTALAAFVPATSKAVITSNIGPSIFKMFPTAAVNIWMRGVHSFLASTALTEISPIWASVAGYYSSHYSVRAIAHLLGCFQLFTIHRTVQLELDGNRFVGTFSPKTGNDREHRLYWKVVKTDPHFAGDSFFTDNNPANERCDVRHRDKANYADHLPQFPTFHPLDRNTIIARINKISSIEIVSAPIPNADDYPDVESVQVVAYHRLVRFRALLDAILGSRNRFWSVHRNPPWSREFMDFQLTDADARKAEFTLS